jgi:hypothetical protein
VLRVIEVLAERVVIAQRHDDAVGQAVCAIAEVWATLQVENGRNSANECATSSQVLFYPLWRNAVLETKPRNVSQGQVRPPLSSSVSHCRRTNHNALC